MSACDSRAAHGVSVTAFRVQSDDRLPPDGRSGALEPAAALAGGTRQETLCARLPPLGTPRPAGVSLYRGRRAPPPRGCEESRVFTPNRHRTSLLKNDERPPCRRWGASRSPVLRLRAGRRRTAPGIRYRSDPTGRRAPGRPRAVHFSSILKEATPSESTWLGRASGPGSTGQGTVGREFTRGVGTRGSSVWRWRDQGVR